MGQLGSRRKALSQQFGGIICTISQFALGKEKKKTQGDYVNEHLQSAALIKKRKHCCQPLDAAVHRS